MIPSATGTLPLDSRILVSTPENVAFDYRLAGPFTRALALLIDITILTVCITGIAIVLSFLGASGIGLLLFIAFVVFWGYGGLMEGLWNGQTLGKKLVGLRVVADTGLAINAGQAMLRNILRYADLFPPFFPGAVAMLFGNRFQRLGDLSAGTMVILDGQRTSPRPPVVEGVTDRMRSRIPSHFRPDPALIECLAAYVGQRQDLSTARRLELSQILARHFIRTWSLPPKINTDHLLCAIYEFATIDEDYRSRGQAKKGVDFRKQTDANELVAVPDNEEINDEGR